MRFSFRSILVVFAILAVILTAVAFFNDIPSRIEKGSIGHEAIKLLDATRRPFLAVKQAEFTIISPPQNRKAKEELLSAIADGKRLLARFIEIAGYEHELKRRVQRLSGLFENWAADEKRFFEISGLPREGAENRANMALYHRQLIKVSDGFLATMAALSDAEAPIHETIHNGDSAFKELRLLAGLFITLMITTIMLLIYQRPHELAVMVKQRHADLNKAVEDLENEIAERKRMEKTFKESEKRYRDLITNLPDAVVVHREGKILFVNSAALSLAGAEKPEELLGKNILDFVSPSYLEKVKKRIANVTEGEKASLSEGKLFRLDGNQIYVEVVGIPIEYEGRKSVQAIIRDITARKEAEEEAQIRQSQLNTIIGSSSDIIYLKDKNFRYLIANKATEEFFSVRAEYMIGKTDFDLMPAENAATCRESDELALQSQDIIRREEYTMNRWLDVVKRAVRDENGNVTSIVGVIRDITERKTAEDKLKKSEASLAEAQRLGRMGSWEYDLKRKRTRWSANLYRLYGYDSGIEPSFEKFIERVHPDDRDRITSFFEIAYQGEEEYQLEYRVIKPDGSERLLLNRFAVEEDEEGRPIFMRGINQDITERKMAEEKLKKSVKILERFNRLAVGREVRMVEMKGEVNALLRELGRREKYAVNGFKYNSSGSRKSEPTL